MQDEARTGGHGELDLELDQDFERRTYYVQVGLWLLMGALVVGGLLGLFGAGLLTNASGSAGGQPSLEVRYDRLIRLQSENEIIVEVSNPPANAGDTVEIEVSKGLWSDLHLTETNPDPDGVTATDDSYIYEFKVDEWTDTVTFHFEFRYDHWGTAGGDFRARTGDSESGVVSISQFVYP
jgi:hypothetical protein